MLVACFMLVSYLAYSSSLKMETTCSSETSDDFQRTTQPYIPEDKAIHEYTPTYSHIPSQKPLERLKRTLVLSLVLHMQREINFGSYMFSETAALQNSQIPKKSS
jgi:hypothetical protein